MEKKNVAMSVRARLLNIRNSEHGTEYMQVLLRYIQERMLYRLSMSQYRDNFCLKGSALLFPKKDVHSHARIRVNGVVMNTDLWYDLYDVNRNNTLYLPKHIQFL